MGPWVAEITFRIGTVIAPVLLKILNLSAVTGVFRGAPRSFQSGISSFKVEGSKHAPERIWLPTLAAFSKTQTEKSSGLSNFSAANCFKRIAADMPAGPEKK